MKDKTMTTELEPWEIARANLDSLVERANIAADVIGGLYEVDDAGRVLNPDHDPEEDARAFIGWDGEPALAGDAVDVDELPTPEDVLSVDRREVFEIALAVGGPAVWIELEYRFGQLNRATYHTTATDDRHTKAAVRMTEDEARAVCTAYGVDVDELPGYGIE